MNPILLLCLFAVPLFGHSCFHFPPSSHEAIVTAPDVDLKSVHRRLEISGFSPGPYNENDLAWLPAPLERFQKFARLEVNGKLDAETWEKLQTLYDPDISAPRNPDGMQYEFVRIIPPSEPGRLHYSLEVNDKAYAFEMAECSDISGDWILFFEGTVTEKQGAAFSLSLERRFAYRNRPEEQGIDNTDWWCVPIRRHCHSQVKFSDWNGKYRPGQVVVFRPPDIANTKNGLINILTLWRKQKCNR